jgi:hypothetical protein
VTAEKNGVWTPPQRLSLPHDAAPHGQSAYLLSVSCVGRDTCTAVGRYAVPYGPRKLAYTYDAAMTAVETDGHWSKTTRLVLSPATQSWCVRSLELGAALPSRSSSGCARSRGGRFRAGALRSPLRAGSQVAPL